jgi:hypothetical protein
MTDNFSIFISHRTEDRFYAALLKSRLEYLGSLEDDLPPIECFVCEAIPGGTEWHQWMIDSTSKADCLLFIHTSAEHNWTWCASEIAQFDGYKRALKKNSKVLWFSVDNSPSFPMLAENQFYGTSDDEVKKFLEDLFVNPTFSNTPLRPKLNVNFYREFNDVVKEIHTQFMQITRPEELFRLRLRITLRDQTLFRQFLAKFAADPTDTRAKNLLSGALLEADASTSAFLVGPEQPKLDWDILSRVQKKYNSDIWLDELVDYVASSFADSEPAARRSREQVLSPIYRESKLFQPVIARLEYLDSAPFSIVVIFVPMPPISEDPRLMIAQDFPKEVVFLSVLQRLSRRFRWTFLEPLYNAVDLPEKFTDDQWVTVLERYEMCNENLDSILRQADMRELQTLGDMLAATGIPDLPLLSEMFHDWTHFRADLAAGIEKKSPRDVLATLKPWLRRNKEFMLLILSVTQKKVQELRPKEDPVALAQDR